MGLLTGALVAYGIGTAISAVGQVKAGRAARQAGELNAQREEFNAGVADLQAADALTRGTQEANLLRSQVRGLIGSQRVGFAGQNVLIGEGSAADVQADAAYLGERDAQQRIRNSELEAWGYRVQAADRRAAAEISRRTGQAAATAGYYGATSTAVGGAANSLLLARYGFGPRTTGPNYANVNLGVGLGV